MSEMSTEQAQVVAKWPNVRYVDELPNGLIRICDTYGHLYVNRDGSKHSRTY